MKAKEPIPPHEPSYTPDELRITERISRTKLYELWKQGKGPRFYFNGRCRIITHQARLDWQREREAEAAQKMTHGGADEAA
jgi:hypothetical protein